MLHKDYIYHTSGNAVHKLGSWVQGNGVLCFRRIGNYSWGFLLLSCVLACSFLAVGVSFLVSLGVLHLL